MTPISLMIPGHLGAKERPRFGRRGGKPYTPAKTVGMENNVRAWVVQQVGMPLIQGPLDVTIGVFLPINPKWPAERQQRCAEGYERPTTGKDADNLAKGLLDALNGVLWRDDAQIVSLTVTKHYHRNPMTWLKVERTAEVDWQEIEPDWDDDATRAMR